MSIAQGRTVTNEQIPLLVDATGRALVVLDAVTGSPLPVTVATALPAGANLIGRVDGRSGNVLNGYAAAVGERTNGAATAAIFTLFNATLVPANTVWVLTSIAGRNNSRNPTRVLFGHSGFGNVIFDDQPAGAGVGVWSIARYIGPFYMPAGTRAFVQFHGSVVGDSCDISVGGYSFAV